MNHYNYCYNLYNICMFYTTPNENNLTIAAVLLCETLTSAICFLYAYSLHGLNNLLASVFGLVKLAWGITRFNKNLNSIFL